MPKLLEEEITLYDKCQHSLDTILAFLRDNEIPSEEKLDEIINDLRNVYLNNNGKDNGFRHRYSSISKIIYETEFSESRDTDYYNDTAQLLAENIDIIYHKVENQENRHFYRMVAKLWDHINLEVQRINYNSNLNKYQDKLFGFLSKSVVSARSDVDKNVEEVTKISDRSKKLEERLQRTQKDYIAILAIFSAVIIAFSGGLGFATGSFSALADVEMSKLICLVSLVGLVLVNLIYILLKFVWNVIRNPNDNNESGDRIPSSGLALILVDVALIIVFLVSAFCTAFDINGWIIELTNNN